MVSGQGHVSLVAQGTGAPSCELCTAETSIPSATMVVRHPRGGIVQLAACCLRLVRSSDTPVGGCHWRAGRVRFGRRWHPSTGQPLDSAKRGTSSQSAGAGSGVVRARTRPS
jgi:hypothetical protein